MKTSHFAWFFFVLLGFLCSCEEGTDDPIAPVDTFESGLTGTINSQQLNINAAGIQSTYFIDQGETVGALEIGAQLPNSERLTFFSKKLKPAKSA